MMPKLIESQLLRDAIEVYDIHRRITEVCAAEGCKVVAARIHHRVSADFDAILAEYMEDRREELIALADANSRRSVGAYWSLTLDPCRDRKNRDEWM
jgi:hypothetical protein